MLLDHILFTHALVNNRLPVSVNPGGARVEHEVHDRINAGLTNNPKTSDHRPVSCFIDG